MLLLLNVSKAQNKTNLFCYCNIIKTLQMVASGLYVSAAWAASIYRWVTDNVLYTSFVSIPEMSVLVNTCIPHEITMLEQVYS